MSESFSLNHERDTSNERKANFNDQVRVKVTPAGERIWDAYWAETRIALGNPGAQRLMRDEEGYSQIQLWELAHVFGPSMYNGNPELPLEMSFLYPESSV